MESENPKPIYCEDDEEYRVYCDACNKLRNKGFSKNHLKPQTHTNNIREKSYIDKLELLL